MGPTHTCRFLGFQNTVQSSNRAARRERRESRGARRERRGVPNETSVDVRERRTKRGVYRTTSNGSYIRFACVVLAKLGHLGNSFPLCPMQTTIERVLERRGPRALELSSEHPDTVYSLKSNGSPPNSSGI